MEIICKKFNQLNINDLYEILSLRSKVFVVEQNCIYQDLDYKDQDSLHLFTRSQGEILAYLRIILSKDKAQIGRVLVKEANRGNSLSKELLIEAISLIFNNYSHNNIEMEAQLYLETFYSSLGFKRISKNFILDGIPHVKMSIKNTLK